MTTMSRLSRFAVLIFVAGALAAVPAAAQSFAVGFPPGNCGTGDNAVVNWVNDTLTGIGGYSCFATYVFPQFAVGSGWTSEVSTFLPVQPAASGLITGTSPSVLALLTPGTGASGPVSSCWGLLSETLKAGASFTYVAPSGGLSTDVFISGTSCPPGSSVPTFPVSGLAQGPLQVQVFAPNAQALQQTGLQLNYSYVSTGFNWAVTVTPINVLSAKATWTAPFYWGSNDSMSYTVVNMSPTRQTVTVTVRDINGNVQQSPMTTALLSAGCGCDSINFEGPQSAAGGFSAVSLASQFGPLSFTNGTITFSANSGGPIVVLVVRVSGTNLFTVPAI
jgi:hypothetical protein